MQSPADGVSQQIMADGDEEDIDFGFGAVITEASPKRVGGGVQASGNLAAEVWGSPGREHKLVRFHFSC